METMLKYLCQSFCSISSFISSFIASFLFFPISICAFPYDAFIFAPRSMNSGMLAVVYSNQVKPIMIAMPCKTPGEIVPNGGTIKLATSKAKAKTITKNRYQGIPRNKLPTNSLISPQYLSVISRAINPSVQILILMNKSRNHLGVP